MRSIILIVLFGAILFTVYTTLTKEKNEVLQIGGDNAPNFTLVDMYGDKHNLEEYKGQGVFLNFWGDLVQTL